MSVGTSYKLLDENADRVSYHVEFLLDEGTDSDFTRFNGWAIYLQNSNTSWASNNNNIYSLKKNLSEPLSIGELVEYDLNLIDYTNEIINAGLENTVLKSFIYVCINNQNIKQDVGKHIVLKVRVTEIVDYTEYNNNKVALEAKYVQNFNTNNINTINTLIDDKLDQYIPKNILNAGYIEITSLGFEKCDSDYIYGNMLNIMDSIDLDDDGNIQISITGTKTFTDLDDTKIYYVGILPYISYPWEAVHGHGYVLHLEIQDNNYTGNDSTSAVINYIMSSLGYDWYPTKASRNIGTGRMVGGYFSGDLDFDDYYDYIIENGKNPGSTVQILFGIYNSAAPTNGVYQTNYADTTFTISGYIKSKNNKVVATELVGFNANNYYNKDEVNQLLENSGDYITCWGDSLTAGGGWTNRLQDLSGMVVYNGGTGGENSQAIVSRQGADAMVVNNITIPATTDPVLIATRSGDAGITTVAGNKVTPLLQGGAHVNPCKIGDIEGTLKWTGSSYADTTGTWTFTRSKAGDAVTIDRPTIIRTNFDMNRNSPHLMIIFIGQNGGYSDLDDLIRQHRLIIEHSKAKHYLILGLSSGTASGRSEYEARMKQEFGRYFLSLREYLSTPLYNSNNEIVSCYGLADQNLEIDTSYTYGGKTTLQEIADGTVPHQILADSVHYTSGTKTVIGDLIYKYCKELNIF